MGQIHRVIKRHRDRHTVWDRALETDTQFEIET